MSVALVQPALHPTTSLTPEQAEEIYARGKEAVIFFLLEQARLIAQLQLKTKIPAAAAVSTPSGMQAPFVKPTLKQRHKKPGRKAGHAGARRDPPAHIDRRVEHRLEQCPDCGGALQRGQRRRTRVIEDLPENLAAEVTEHTLHRDYCPACKKSVEPIITAALPGSTLGNRVLVLTAWLHYALGNTLSQIIEVFNFHLPIKLTPGGLCDQWRRLAHVLAAWHEQIQCGCLQAGVLHADETGWRVNGKTEWLWCFTSADATCYRVDPSRGSPALARFFSDYFAGTLVSDFWGAYNKVRCARRQLCLVHLLRDFVRVQKLGHDSAPWRAFAKKAKRLIGDAIRLHKNGTLADERYVRLRLRITTRLRQLLETSWSDVHARRLVKRLRRHEHELFTFLDHDDVPFENNAAERAIRPAVIMRKNSYCNRSREAARTQSILMSVYRTLKQRGLDPIAATTQALAEYLKTGQLPPLPKKVTANG